MPAAGLGPDNILNAALASFLTAIEAYFPLLLIWGARLLQCFTLLGLGYLLIQAMLKGSWMSAMMSMGFAMIRLAVIQGAMMNLELVGRMFPDMGLIIGSQISGQSPAVLTPSGFYSLGLNIVDMLIKARHAGSWFNLVDDFEFAVLILLTQITWFAAAAVYMWLIFECEWLWIKGPLTICFSAFDYTWMTFTSWFVQLLRIGIKLLATLLILAIGLTVAGQWTVWLGGMGITINTNSVQYGAIELVEALILFYAVWAMPARAANIIHGYAGNVGTMEGEGGRAIYNLAGNTARATGRAVTTGVSSAARVAGL